MDFAGEIIEWYKVNKRDLPWRSTTDPYIIWLSEIIMQQTRVEQGTPYFIRFAEKYPTVADFASAREDEILKLWQGLGYYSRGRNMHHTARLVMEEHAGYFPSDYESLIRLKGVGEYTAAAISSFSSDEARAVVDGNVFRLLSRFFGIDIPVNSGKGKKAFTELANELIDKSRPGIYNQAAMEFGSLVCRPRNPACQDCVLRQGCEAYRTGRINELPVKLKTGKTRDRYFNYVLASSSRGILMNKRGPGDIWENLYELPLFETAELYEPGDLVNSEQFKNTFGHQARIRSVTKPPVHILSHQKLYATFIEIENYSEQFAPESGWFYVKMDDIEKMAQPKLIFQFFKKFFKLTD